MKLFFTCACGSKAPLQSSALTRNVLFNSYGSHLNVNCTVCRNRVSVPVNGVWAESKYDYAAGAGFAGGAAVGVIAGPLGMIIGGVVGVIAGNSARVNDKKAAMRFNNSRI